MENVTEMRKIRGQGYDGAANMSGAYDGVQALMRQKAPNARNIHCAAHALNLVINDAVKNVTELRNFLTCSKNCTFSSVQSVDELVCRRSALVPLHWSDCVQPFGHHAIKLWSLFEVDLLMSWSCLRCCLLVGRKVTKNVRLRRCRNILNTSRQSW